MAQISLSEFAKKLDIKRNAGPNIYANPKNGKLFLNNIPSNYDIGEFIDFIADDDEEYENYLIISPNGKLKKVSDVYESEDKLFKNCSIHISKNIKDILKILDSVDLSYNYKSKFGNYNNKRCIMIDLNSRYEPNRKIKKDKNID
jgi:hypothetical protein